MVRDALSAIRPVVAEGPVFRGNCGPYTDRGIRNLLAVLSWRADLSHVHPHEFRHDTARRLVEHVDLPTVAALLGHSRLDTVRVYAQPNVYALDRARREPRAPGLTSASFLAHIKGVHLSRRGCSVGDRFTDVLEDELVAHDAITAVARSELLAAGQPSKRRSG